MTWLCTVGSAQSEQVQPLIEQDVRGSGQHSPDHRDRGLGHGRSADRFRRSSLADNPSARSDQNDSCSAIQAAAGCSPAERTVPYPSIWVRILTPGELVVPAR